MPRLEQLAQLDKSGLKKMTSVTNGNETHLELIEKVQSQEKLNSFHLGKKKPAVAKKPAAKPKKRERSQSPPPPQLEEGDWSQDDCKDGQVKNPKTKKCVKKCDDDKVRNNATGRCVNQKGKKTKKSVDAAVDALPVEHDSSSDDDWPQDNCEAGKVKNPKTKNCVKKCDDDKSRNKTTGRCVNRKSKSPQVAEPVQHEDVQDLRVDLNGLGVTKLKEIAKKLKLSKYSHYKNTPEDIDELRQRIEDRQDQLYGRKRDEPVQVEELVPERVISEHVEEKESLVPEEVAPVREDKPQEDVPPRDDHKYDEEDEIRPNMRTLLCDPLDDKRSCDGDDVCLVDDSGKGKCQSKDDDPLSFYETMTFNGKNVIGTRESLNLLRDKLKVPQPQPLLPPIAADEDITSILRELSDAPDNDDVLNDPSIKELIRCLFKR
jgi:hypothetical protein